LAQASAIVVDIESAIEIVARQSSPWLQSATMIQLRPLTEAEAHAVARWRYEPPYDFYDGSETEVLVMLDPVNQYRAIHLDNEFVGYVCVGPDAMVSGQEAGADIDDIGWGFRPDLTGRGLASTWIRMALDLLDDLLAAPTQRVVIAAWNKRSQAVARHLGFEDPVPLSNAGREWVILTRPRPIVSGRSRG
jgi:RimJ/RimL family protein N-acetyltransferase